jgi:uncharacterized protein YggE
MSKLATLFAAVALLWPATGGAQTGPSVVVVQGLGIAQQAPDAAAFGYTVRGEGKTEVAALQAMNEARAQIETQLKDLAGTTAVDITTAGLSVSPARGPDCKDDDVPTSLSAGPCAIVGYVATLRTSVSVAPADKVGDAISLASERGAVGAAFSQWTVRDGAGLRAAAARQAMKDARSQAEQIATSSGLRLGPILKIEDQSRDPSRDAFGINSVVDLANFKPTVSVGVKPEPVEARAAYTITFAIAP